MESKSAWTPYAGWQLRGAPVRTLLRGKTVAQDGRVPGSRVMAIHRRSGTALRAPGRSSRPASRSKLTDLPAREPCSEFLPAAPPVVSGQRDDMVRLPERLVNVPSHATQRYGLAQVAQLLADRWHSSFSIDERPPPPLSAEFAWLESILSPRRPTRTRVELRRTSCSSGRRPKAAAPPLSRHFGTRPEQVDVRPILPSQGSARTEPMSPT